MDSQSQNKLEPPLSKSNGGSQISLAVAASTTPIKSSESINLPSVSSDFKDYIVQMNLAYSTEAMKSSQQSFGSRQQILDSDSDDDPSNDRLDDSRSFARDSSDSFIVSEDQSRDVLIDIPSEEESLDVQMQMPVILDPASDPKVAPGYSKVRRVSFQEEDSITILPPNESVTKGSQDIPIIDVEITDDDDTYLETSLNARMQPLQTTTNELLTVIRKGGFASSMPNGIYNVSYESEEAEARDQVSELKLTSSVFTSTLFSDAPGSNENSNEQINQEGKNDMDLSQSFGSSASSFGKHLRNLSHGYGKKLSGVSAPVTPMISTHALSSKSSEEGPYPLSIQIQPENTLGEPPKKMTQIALSAHEMHPPPLKSDKEFSIDDFTVLRKVGKGGFAKVFLVRQKKSSQKYYAMKCIKKEDIIRLKQEKQILNEKNILTKFKHPFIVDLFHTFQTRTHLFMTLEFVPGGDLYTLMKTTKVISKFKMLRETKFILFMITARISGRSLSILHL
jgi:hypothetical protein